MSSGSDVDVWAAVGFGAAATGALPRQVFAQAPAVLKGTKLSILQGTYFIAPAQDLYKGQAEEWGKKNGVEMSADFLNWPDLQPKIAAAIQAGGVDIVELWPSWNYLYQNSLVDMTPEAEEFGKQMGVEVQVERIGENDITTRSTATSPRCR